VGLARADRDIPADITERSGFHLRGKPLVVVSAAPLGVIQRGVGVREHRIGVAAIVGEETDPDAQRNTEPIAGDDMGLGHGRDQLFRDAGRVLHRFDFG
jgi:hypothetical protein